MNFKMKEALLKGQGKGLVHEMIEETFLGLFDPTVITCLTKMTFISKMLPSVLGCF